MHYENTFDSNFRRKERTWRWQKTEIPEPTTMKVQTTADKDLKARGVLA